MFAVYYAFVRNFNAVSTNSQTKLKQILARGVWLNNFCHQFKVHVLGKYVAKQEVFCFCIASASFAIVSHNGCLSNIMTYFCEDQSICLHILNAITCLHTQSHLCNQLSTSVSTVVCVNTGSSHKYWALLSALSQHSYRTVT